MRLHDLRRRIHSLLFVLLVIALLVETALAHGTGFFNPELLVEPDWLLDYGDLANVRVVDFGRQRSDYEESHIPGAVFVDMCLLTREVDCVPGMMAHVETVVEVLEAAGLSSETTVVVYDDSGGLRASRLFWVMEYLGHEDVRLLNGGFDRWLSEGLEVSQEQPQPARGHLAPEVRSDRLATKDWVLANLDEPDVVILDVRSREEYMGLEAKAERGGRIPGSIHIDWSWNLDGNGARVFLDHDELLDLYASSGVTPDKEVATYCQAGVRASHTYFALRLMGYPRVRMYDGSWAEWGNDSRTPVVSDEAAQADDSAGETTESDESTGEPAEEMEPGGDEESQDEAGQ